MQEKEQDIRLVFATEAHLSYCQEISDAIARAAQDKASGLALRDSSYLAEKIREGHGVIALAYESSESEAAVGSAADGNQAGDGGQAAGGDQAGDATAADGDLAADGRAGTMVPKLAGFCYIQPWEHGLFVAHSALIVLPEFRGRGLATAIKQKAFELTRLRFPDAKVFGLTTSPAVRKINLALGYREVPYREITSDLRFWKGCCSCVHYDTLCKAGFETCKCTAMVWES